MGPMVSHGLYLMNLGAPDREVPTGPPAKGKVRNIYRSSIESLTQHLEIGEALGLSGVVLHVGSSKGSTTDEAIARIGAGIGEALDAVPGVDVLDHLGDLLEGLFDMLSDGNREVRHAAHSALTGFLSQIDALGGGDLAARLQLGAWPARFACGVSPTFAASTRLPVGSWSTSSKPLQACQFE